MISKKLTDLLDWLSVVSTWTNVDGRVVLTSRGLKCKTAFDAWADLDDSEMLGDSGPNVLVHHAAAGGDEDVVVSPFSAVIAFSVDEHALNPHAPEFTYHSPPSAPLPCVINPGEAYEDPRVRMLPSIGAQLDSVLQQVCWLYLLVCQSRRLPSRTLKLASVQVKKK